MWAARGKLFATEPFQSRKPDFNVRVLELPAPKSGVHRPRTRDDRRSYTGVEYNIFDSERYVLTLDNKSLRDVASSAPYDFLEILVNEKQYGGGGIFNDQATSSVDSGFSEYVFVHEFGHHFAGLGDEYYTSDVAYETGGTGIRAVGAEHHASGRIRSGWASSPGTPLPTPWQKEEFEKRSASTRPSAASCASRMSGVADGRALPPRAEYERSSSDRRRTRESGAFEGGIRGEGLYRPEVDCIMFRGRGGFLRRLHARNSQHDRYADQVESSAGCPSHSSLVRPPLCSARISRV
jgi:hypothetical protein